MNYNRKNIELSLTRTNTFNADSLCQNCQKNSSEVKEEKKPNSKNDKDSCKKLKKVSNKQL